MSAIDDLAVLNENVISVMGDLYTKKPKALKQLLQSLRIKGYTIDNLREAEYRKREGTSIETMEKQGWSLWFAHLQDLRKGKCKTCNSLINVAGVQSHGHQCEICGSVTFYKIIDGSTIRFEFISEKYRGVMFAPQLNMKAKRWDTEEDYLYLYYEFLDRGSFGVIQGEKAEAYLQEHKDLWTVVEEDGVKLLKVKYPLEWDRNEAAIEAMEIYGHHWNHKIVRIWKDKEYEEYGDFPVPESISIYEAWHWAPLSASPTIHSRILSAARQTDDQGYFYQDGRPYFTNGHWTEMAKFIRHFTSLDADAFDRAWSTFRRDGPGGIADLASFCHSKPAIRNDPNVGNVLVALSKGLSGQELTDGEVEAAKHGLEDPMTRVLLSQEPPERVKTAEVPKQSRLSSFIRRIARRFGRSYAF